MWPLRALIQAGAAYISCSGIRLRAQDLWFRNEDERRGIYIFLHRHLDFAVTHNSPLSLTHYTLLTGNAQLHRLCGGGTSHPDSAVG